MDSSQNNEESNPPCVLASACVTTLYLQATTQEEPSKIQDSPVEPSVQASGAWYQRMQGLDGYMRKVLLIDWPIAICLLNSLSK